MSALGDKQKKFAKLVAGLINKAHEMGYEMSLGDAYRDPSVFGVLGEKRGYGHPKSGHKQRLAIDLNLYHEGRYLTETEDHRLLGEWWEGVDPDCRWGGRFNDGNHYSLEHDGVK